MLWSRPRDGDDLQLSRVLAIVSLAQFVMFLTLLKVKTTNYMIGLWPLGALVLAWLGIWLWDRHITLLRVIVIVSFGLIMTEGITRIAHARSVARKVLPYDWYTREIAGCIPHGSRVLGLQHYWFGLRQYDYRTWLVPTIYANPLYHDPPVPLDVTLEQIDPDIILIDRYMSTFFNAAARPDHPMHRVHTEFNAFMDARHAEPLCAIRSATYGTMSVYYVPNLSSR
jgi:hypothetical protein